MQKVFQIASGRSTLSHGTYLLIPVPDNSNKFPLVTFLGPGAVARSRGFSGQTVPRHTSAAFVEFLGDSVSASIARHRFTTNG
jgi:hypothetical protein